jgi:hypothetical protein
MTQYINIYVISFAIGIINITADIISCVSYALQWINENETKSTTESRNRLQIYLPIIIYFMLHALVCYYLMDGICKYLTRHLIPYIIITFLEVVIFFAILISFLFSNSITNRSNRGDLVISDFFMYKISPNIGFINLLIYIIVCIFKVISLLVIWKCYSSMLNAFSNLYTFSNITMSSHVTLNHYNSTPPDYETACKEIDPPDYESALKYNNAFQEGNYPEVT